MEPPRADGERMRNTRTATRRPDRHPTPGPTRRPDPPDGQSSFPCALATDWTVRPVLGWNHRPQLLIWWWTGLPVRFRTGTTGIEDWWSGRAPGRPRRWQLAVRESLPQLECELACTANGVVAEEGEYVVAGGEERFDARRPTVERGGVVVVPA